MARAVGLKAWTIQTEAVYILDRLIRLTDQCLSPKALYPKGSAELS